MFKRARQIVRYGGERLARAIAPDMSRRADLTRAIGLGLPGGGFANNFEAGKLNRRDADFVPQGLGPNAMAEVGNLDLVIRRCRDLADNNPIVDGAINARVNNIIGTGINWFPDTPWDDVNERLEELHELDVRRVDPERQVTLWESQRLFERELEVAGEVLVYYPIVEAFGNSPAGVAIELIARERIPLDVSGILNGNEVRQGVEYDKQNRVVAYHVLTRHPKDGGVFGGFGAGGWWGGSYALGSKNLVRVDASRCELAFVDRRIEQLRGVPRMVTVVNTIRMEDGYQDDAMLGARLQLSHAFVIEINGNLSQFMSKKDQKLLNGQEPVALDANMRPLQRVEPGAIVYIKAGSNPKMMQPTLPGTQFPAVEAVLQRRISKGIGIDYATLSGDSSQSNFSSARMDALVSRDDYRPASKFAWEHHTDPWRRGQIMLHVLTGRLPLTSEQRAEIARHPELLFRCSVGFKGFEYVNPSQEATANATDINTGVVSEIQSIASKDGDYRKISRQLAKFEAQVRKDRIAAGLPPERPKQGISGGAAPTSGGDGADGNGDGNGDGGDTNKNDTAKNERLKQLGLLNGHAN